MTLDYINQLLPFLAYSPATNPVQQSSFSHPRAASRRALFRPKIFTPSVPIVRPSNLSRNSIISSSLSPMEVGRPISQMLVAISSNNELSLVEALAGRSWFKLEAVIFMIDAGPLLPVIVAQEGRTRRKVWNQTARALRCGLFREVLAEYSLCIVYSVLLYTAEHPSVPCWSGWIYMPHPQVPASSSGFYNPSIWYCLRTPILAKFIRRTT